MPLPEQLGTVFQARSAQEYGVTRARLGGADLERPFRGIYRRVEETGGEPQHPAATWRMRQLRNAEALASFLPTGYFFCGRTAAVIWRIPVPAGGGEEVEVACFSPGRALRMRGVRGSRIDARLARVDLRGGLPVTDAATTWCMLAPRLAWRDGIALGDGVIRRPRIPGTQRLSRAPYATIGELELAARLPYRRGHSLLLRMLPLLSPHSASAPESHLRLALRDWGAPDPALDFDVYDAGGRLLGCSEIAFPEYRVVQEYEGDHHRTGREQWNRDIEKHRDYARAGWDTIRVTSELLYRKPEKLRDETWDALSKGGWHPPA